MDKAIVFDPFRLPTFDDSWKRECRTCVHLQATASMVEGCHTIMRCRAVVVKNNKGHCIDARASDGDCGPDAKLWGRA